MPYINMAEETGYDALMTFTCVGMGYCGSIKNNQPMHIDLLIPDHGMVTADQFVEWVFLADNMNPNTNLEVWQKHKDSIKAAFIEHMGAEIVDATKLKQTSDGQTASVIAEIEKCQEEIRNVRPEVYIRNLIALEKGVFYPVNQIIGKDPAPYSKIQICWLEHDAYWLESEEEPADYIKILFYHETVSEINRTVFNLTNL